MILRGLILLLLAAASSSQVVAQYADANSSPPTAFGQDYYFTEVIESLVPFQGNTRAPEGDAWRQQLSDLEWQGGPYSSQLGEFLSQKAAYFEQAGDYEGAVSSLRRAVHITRVNEGLQSELQVPLVRRLVENYLALEELAAVDELQDYLFFLFQRQHAAGSIEYIDAAVEFLDWQRQAWLAEVGKTRERRLYNAFRLVRELLDDELLEASLPLDSRRALVSVRMRLYYLLEQGDFGVLVNYGSAFRNPPPTDPNFEMSVEERFLLNLQRGAYPRGRKDLEALIDEYLQADDPLGAARTRIALADWHIWHGQHRRAAADYAEAWNALSVPAYISERQRLLGAVVELPAGDVYFSPIAVRRGAVKTVPVNATFAVTSRGSAREIEVAPVRAEDERFVNQLIRKIKRAKFRPAIVEGELVEMRSVNRAYSVMYQ